MAIARGQITIVDLNDGRSINAFIQSNHPTTQIYTHGTANNYTPNYANNALVLTPQIFVSGEAGDMINNLKAKPTWKINGGSVDTYGTVANTAPYALTINKNMVDVSQMHIECSMVFQDPSTQIETPAKADITFTKVNNAGDTICAVMYSLNGTTINRGENDTINQVTLHCDMWRGSDIDNTDVGYKWFRLGASGWVELTASAWGSSTTTNELKVEAKNVTNFEVFKCEVEDKDSGAPTYGQKVSDTITVNDVTDPYTVELVAPSGSVLARGMDTTQVTAYIWQNGEICSDTLHTNAKYSWAGYNKSGNPITFASGTVTNARTFTVTKAMVSVRATFVCTVTI